MKIFFSVGEPSGDLHGANLIAQLRARRPDVECVGYGGPKMRAAGCDLHEDLTRLAVMWFLRVLLNIHEFWNLLVRADRYFARQRPDAVVLIDYPGFNWWIARRAKAHGIPVFYYSPPQVWAWASWRVKKMRRFVDHVLCGLPFEEDWFRAQGCNATFVGHPYFDEARGHRLDEPFCREQRTMGGPLVAILPGSRTQEVTHNLRWFLEAATIVHRQVPGVRFAVASFKPHQAELARKMIEDVGFRVRGSGFGEGPVVSGPSRDASAVFGPQPPSDATRRICTPDPRPLNPEPRTLNPEPRTLNPEPLRIDVHCGKTPELIHLADCCMAVSGSVSLELLYHTKPTVVLYWVSRFAYFVQSFFRKVKYITLVNLLTADELFPKNLASYDPRQPDADRVLFPEYLTCEDKSQQIAAHVIEWLTDPAARGKRVGQLIDLKTRIAHGGASCKAAQYILEHVTPADPARRSVPRLHFQTGGERRRPAA